MKSQQFPVFLTSPKSSLKVINAQQFIKHLSELQQPQHIQQHLKKIEENIYILTKQSHNQQHIRQLVIILCQMFKQAPLVEIITLIRSAICPDIKYEAKQKPYDDILHNENIRNAVSSEPIALPYEPAGAPIYGPIAPPYIATYDQSNNDMMQQERSFDSKSYYEADDLIVATYLQKRFKTVKRQGISDFFTQISEMICTELLESYLEENFLALSVPVLVELLKLLEYITPPIYTYHLQAIIKAITNNFLVFLEKKENQKVLTKDDYKTISYTFNNIAQRLEKDPAFSLQNWNWQTDTRMIILFMTSSVSQKKLFAIKSLGQICRRSLYYNYSISTERIKMFIVSNGILEAIYNDQNHPQVIAKGEETYLYMSKNQTFTQNYLDLLFNILEKCNENLSKLLFNTLQKLQQRNIENNKDYILRKIAELPRANCFNQETFSCIQKIALLTPPENIMAIIEKIYIIIQKHYQGFRFSLREQSVKLFLEVYTMGVQLTVINENNAIVPLNQLLKHKQSPMYMHIIDGLILNLKDKTYHKTIGNTCRKMLQSVIKNFIKKQKIHKLKFCKKEKHQKIIMLMLESYQKQQNDLLSPQQLWDLIKKNNKFSKFIKNYHQQIQIIMISSLVQTQNKTNKDLQCIIQLYHMLNPNVRHKLQGLIVKQFHKIKDLECKYVLASQVLNIEPYKFQQVFSKLEKSSFNPLQIMNWLIILRQILVKQDEKGYGDYPPYLYFHNSYDIFIKIFCHKSLRTNELELIVKSYSTLFQISSKILDICELPFEKSKIKVNDSYLEIPDLKKKISQHTVYKKISIQIYETQDCQWVDKSQLFDKDNSFKIEVSDAFKEIFYKFNDQKGKLYPANIAQIFKIATNQDNISAYDSRVAQIINVYSNNGMYLNLEQWLNFYYQSALKHSTVVVSNLINLGYRQIFSQQQKFQDMFANQHQLRKIIAKDNRIFKALFLLYQKNIIQCQEDMIRDQLTQQLVKTLNLLPIYENMLFELQEHRQLFVNLQYLNHLYDWYLSKLLRYLYFNEQNLKWKVQFDQSSNNIQLKILYIKYLDLIFQRQPYKQFQKDDIIINNIQNLGLINREGLTKIPNLVKFNIMSNIPLNLDNIDENFIQITNIQQFQFKMDILANLCLNIYKYQNSICIVENSMAIIIYLVLKQSRVKPIKQIEVMQHLIFHEVENIRKLFNSFYYLLSNTVYSIKKAYYSVRINKNKYSKTCRQYFNVLSKMLSFEEDQKLLNFLSQYYQKDISNSLNKQSLNFSQQTDQIILGELKVINQIKIYNPKIKIQETTIIAIEQLLENNSSEEIRQILYILSHSICSFQTNLAIINKIMKGLNLSKNSSKRNGNKMGMLNLGSTCYINSVIQQLEHIIPFRKGIINTQIHDNNNIDFFKQFQYMIYQLTFGQRSYFVTELFCLNFLDYNGNPVNVRMQHDADEFLNTLFDKLQTSLKGKNEQLLIASNFRGQVINTIHCDSCFKLKQKIENIYIVSVEIKNFKNLEECLNKYIQHEIITDFYCEHCDRKVETIQKYNLFKNLPPFLFIHLQRLVFDLEEFRKIKLDHVINFPQQINFSQYFKTQYQTQNNRYKLKGFIVHIGSSEGGHYYSIIKCDGQWFKFDDIRVDVWNWNDSSHDVNNAYMLIYERYIQNQSTTLKELNIGNKVIMENIRRDNFDLKKQEIFLQPSFMRFLLENFLRINIPPQFQIQPQALLSPYHERLLQLDLKTQKQLQLGFETILQFLKLEFQKRELVAYRNYQVIHDKNQKSSSQSQFQKLGLYLMYCLHFKPQLTGKLIDEYLSQENINFFNIIYLHKDLEARQIVKVILCKVFVILKTQIFTNFLVPVPQNKPLQRLLEKVIYSLSQVGKNTQKMGLYFQLIIWLIRADDRFGQWFQCNKLGPRLIHFLLQSDSPLEKIFPSYPIYLNSSGKNSNIEIIINILVYLVKYQKDISSSSPDLQIQKTAYLNFDLYRRIFKDRYDNAGIPSLIAFCAKNNAEFNTQIVTFIIQSLNRTCHTDKFIFTYISTMYNLLTIRDDLEGERYQKFLGVPLLLKKYDKQGEQYMIKTKNDRYCRYQNASERKGDQIFLSFLELLYINRKQQNYFVLFGITALLQLKSSSKFVSNYIENMPGPCPAYPNYTDWIHQFLYDSQKFKSQIHRDIPAKQRQDILTNIAKLINNYQDCEDQSKQNHELRKIKHQENNKLFNIQEILDSTGWIPISLSFQKHFIIQEECPDVKVINVNEFVNAEQRILFQSTFDGQKINKIIQYRITFYCRLKIYFTSGFPYSFYFQKGYYQFALPYVKDQSTFMKCQIQKGQIKKLINQRKQQIQKKMDVENLDQQQNQKTEQEFPSINEVYPLPNDMLAAVNDAKVKEEVELGTTFQCPFCLYVSPTYSSRCKNCNQELGQMNWY